MMYWNMQTGGMKGMNKYILFFLFVATMQSCGPGSLEAGDLLKWMENPENGLRQTKNEGAVTYIIQYKNLDYISLKKGEALGSEEERQKLREDIENKCLFDLYLTCDNGSVSPLFYKVNSENEVNDRYYYYQFHFVNDLALEYGSEKIAPLYCIADKGSGLNNTMAFSLAFMLPKGKEDDIKLVIKDPFLGSGTVKFIFKAKNIKHIPNLKV